MSQHVVVTLAFTSDWLASTGGSGSGDFDDLVQRVGGLPVVPMSSVKGVLREAAERLEAASRSGWANGTVETLFGRRPAPGSGDSTRGCLVFSGHARLPAADRRAFSARASAARALYARRTATAIDPASGVAQARTLRSAEVAVPMTLQGVVRLREGAGAPKAWRDRLDEAAAWTLALGKGKADGLGRVLISIGSLVTDTPRPADPDPPGRLVVLLEQTEAAAFTARSATEGAHETRLCVPGSALMGWAARDYVNFVDPWTAFHSGKVRFGDARPLAADNDLLWPMPQAILEPKHGGAGVVDGRLTARARVRRPEPGEGAIRVQYDRVKPKLVTGAGATGKIAARLALRTAMRDGRPATGELFGYTSLTADPDKPSRYVAVIEQDGLNDKDWGRIVESFRAPELLLGRAAGGGQGGVFRPTILKDQETAPPVPEPRLGRVVVWALSDLALIDEHGEPDLAPGPRSLGLGKGELLEDESAIGTRRYAPWRGHLQSRDVEQAVIEAGSVLVYRIDETLPGAWPAVVGLHREQGLGRVWINPPLVEGLCVGDGEIRLSESPLQPVRNLPDATVTAGDDASPLCGWAAAKVAAVRSESEVLAYFDAEWRPILRSFYAAPMRGDGPSRAQWNSIVGVGTPSLHENTQTRDWGKEAWPSGDFAAPLALRDWLAGAINREGDPVRAKALLKMAADAADDLKREALGDDR